MSDNPLLDLKRKNVEGQEKSERIASNTEIQQYDNTANSTAVLPTVQQAVLPDVDAMFKSKTQVVTFRLPEDVSDWLGDQAHKGRKQGVTRQSQIWDALREYIEKRLEE
jgi:hypothetical protein